uniref:beta family protein n=1 Tax=Streptomyces sp. CRN 30 TaxID=3075613 RepID=UPI002A840DCB
MSVPLYVPVLPASRHATRAYDVLLPEIRAGVAPLWTLHPHPGLRPKDAIRRIGLDTGYVAGVQKQGHAWLDAPYADADEAALLPGALAPEWWEHRNLCPVTGPGRPDAQQSLALAVARLLGKGIGMRVPLPGEWHDRIAEEVMSLLGRLATGTRVDLFLDLMTVSPRRPDAAKEALRALDMLVPLASWRTVAVLSGGFPESPEGLRRGVPHEEPRPDWDTWHEISHSEPSYLSQLRYGDYATHPVSYVSDPAPGRPGAWGLLRYTTARSYHLVKVRHGKSYDAQNRSAARLITGLSDFRGSGASAGERWLCRR